MIKDDRLNAFLFVVAPSCIPYPTLAFKKTSGTDGLEEGKKTSEGKRMSEKAEKGAEVLYFPSNCGDEAQMFADRR